LKKKMILYICNSISSLTKNAAVISAIGFQAGLTLD